MYQNVVLGVGRRIMVNVDTYSSLIVVRMLIGEVVI